MKSLKNRIVVIIFFTIVFSLSTQRMVLGMGGQAQNTNSLYENSSTNYPISYFWELIRSMETSTGTIGKDSNIDTSGDFADDSGNGIDCHMEKNTEYGAVALLAFSEFGNKTSTDSESTGSNNTGVFQMNNGKYEFVSAVWKETENGEIKTTGNINESLIRANDRYKDIYVGSSGYKDGDGMRETEFWGGKNRFFDKNSNVLLRGDSGMFGYSSCAGVAGYYDNASGSYVGRGARAVVVCGPGL